LNEINIVLSNRRPGGDSDHGYSTMTHHEESELAGPPHIEPLLVGRDKIRLVNSSQSEAVNSRSSSPSVVGQTIIEVPQNHNNIVAQVQVHIVDTH
jgi:hypothetical protein